MEEQLLQFLQVVQNDGGFGPKVNGFDHFDFGDHKTLEKVVNKNTAAVMVETIMGEGGIKVIPDWC